MNLLPPPPYLSEAKQQRWLASRRLTPSERASIRMSANYTCSYCGRPGTMHKDPDGSPWHVDHVHPISRGGSLERSNTVNACAHCNRIKGAMTPTELYDQIALILSHRYALEAS